MRIALRYPDHLGAAGAEFADPRTITTVARAAESAGFDAVFVTDHPIPSPDFDRVGGHHSFDPFVILGFVAGVTTTLQLLTFLVVLPYRNPFLTAKAAATLDVVSGGRLLLGVGAGYMREEFAALGVDDRERNALVDEAIDVMKLAWTGEPVHVAGRHFVADGNVAWPTPVQQPHPPLWCGGNGPRAIRRAVERGDAWMPFPASAERAGVVRTSPMSSLDDLGRGLDLAREHAASVGRTVPLDVVFMPLGRHTYGAAPDLGALVDDAGRLAGMGVTYLTTQFPVTTADELLDAIERFAVEAMPQIDLIEPSNTVCGAS
jgi:probable F420-dependent oxidoreductase